MPKRENLGIGTRLVHGGQTPDPQFGAIAPLLVRSKTYQQPIFGVESKWQYSRGTNPTRSMLERQLEAIVGDGQAVTYGTGDAATTMFLLTLKPGDHIIACKELYGGSIRLFNQLFADFGISTSYVDVEDMAAVKAAKKAGQNILWVESPTNPRLGIINLDKCGRIAAELDLHYLVDLTFAPPCTTDPFACGADTVLYSLSKYFAGHNDTLGGALITKDEALYQRLKWLQWSVGAVLSPDECYRIIQGLKTLEMRWVRTSDSAQKVTEFLQKHEQVQAVYYPGLPDHPSHDIAKKQMANGFGSALAFDLKSNDLKIIKQFVDNLKSSNLVVFGESLASPETILAHPASMSHRSLTQDHRDDLTIGNNFFRLSIGFEDPADIIRVFDQALNIFKFR